METSEAHVVLYAAFVTLHTESKVKKTKKTMLDEDSAVADLAVTNYGIVESAPKVMMSSSLGQLNEHKSIK